VRLDTDKHGSMPMNNKKAIAAIEQLESLILTIRGQKVMLDADLACIYGAPTKRLNEQVKRNCDRFPEDFVFQLTQDEAVTLLHSRSQFATLKRGQNIKYRPYAFTEHGAIMAANVLNSPRAVAMSVYVVRAFVRLRGELAATLTLEKRLAEIERMLIGHDAALRDLYQKIRPLLLPPTEPNRKGIGFHVKERRGRYAVAG
jgi:hypothetical protein